MTGGSPRVLAYSHDGYGLGHLRRNLRIVTALRRHRPDAEVLLASGAVSAQRVVGSSGVGLLQLPSLVKVGPGRYRAVDGPADVEAVIAQRSEMLADAVRAFRPDLLLVDRYPRGMHDELAAGLMLHRERDPRALAVLGLRDIIDAPEVVTTEWRDGGYDQAIADLYDAVLCYGDPGVFDPVHEYGLPKVVTDRVRFTGYLADDLLASDAAAVRRAHCGDGQRLAVCTVGGGKDAAPVARAFTAAVRRLEPHGWAGVLIAGPYMAESDLAQVRRGAGSVHVLQMVRDVPSYLAAADVVVTMAGYNTTCEVLALAAPAVAVPRVQPRTEQLMRAQRLADRGLLGLLHPEGLEGSALAAAMLQAARVDRVQLAGRVAAIAHSGINAAVRHLAGLLDERAGAARTPAGAVHVLG